MHHRKLRSLFFCEVFKTDCSDLPPPWDLALSVEMKVLNMQAFYNANDLHKWCVSACQWAQKRSHDSPPCVLAAGSGQWVSDPNTDGPFWIRYVPAPSRLILAGIGNGPIETCLHYLILEQLAWTVLPLNFFLLVFQISVGTHLPDLVELWIKFSCQGYSLIPSPSYLVIITTAPYLQHRGMNASSQPGLV